MKIEIIKSGDMKWKNRINYFYATIGMGPFHFESEGIFDAVGMHLFFNSTAIN